MRFFRLVRAIVVTDNRLPALTDSLSRHCYKLVDACDDRHSQPFLWVCAHDFMYARRLLSVLL